MLFLDQLFLLSLSIQIIHSVEELSTGFHKKWYLLKMPFLVFPLFEISFSSFWIGVYIFHNFPVRQILQEFFLILMFANGVQHIIWAISVKKYVPGLITAPFHILIFLIFYFKIFS